MPRAEPRIDVHAHLAGVGTEDSGCWISPEFRRRPTFRLLRRWYGITAEQMRTTVDADWAALLARTVRASPLSHAVALGFDGVYDPAGGLDRARSQMIVPPAWVFAVCRRHPELLPGPSVNPGRRDALDRLEECIEGGAVLLKWLPIAQVIDPAAPRHRAFLRRMADARLPLLIHSGGGERVFRTVAPELNGVERLGVPLEMGVPVICAHSGTRVLFSRDPDQTAELRALLERHPNLWLDNSGMANPSRFAHLPRLAADPLFRDRTLYGSDFPVPAIAALCAPWLGVRRAWTLGREPNLLARDVAIKRAVGYPDATLERAAALLPGLARWTER